MGVAGVQTVYKALGRQFQAEGLQLKAQYWSWGQPPARSHFQQSQFHGAPDILALEIHTSRSFQNGNLKCSLKGAP